MDGSVEIPLKVELAVDKYQIVKSIKNKLKTSTKY